MRTNTLSLEFVGMENKLSAYETHVFIQGKFQLQADEVISIGIYGNKIMLKVATADILENIFETWENKLEYTDANNRLFQVKLSNESRKNIVKIHRIPIEIPENEIRRALSAYGAIEEIRNDSWKNLPYKCYNDVKIVKVEIQRPIPSYIRIMGKQYWTTYIGQPKTCRRCASTEHEAKDCCFAPENRIRAVHNYADALSRNFRRQYDADREELLEENFTVLKSKEATATASKVDLAAKENRKEGKDSAGEVTAQVVIQEQVNLDAHAETLRSDDTELGDGIPKTMDHDSLERPSEVKTDDEWQTMANRKRRKGESSDSGGEGSKPHTKKVNWADELYDNPPQEQDHSTRLSRQSSDDSTY